ncbi:unnamed protein product [Prorocentrum cordatum]|uniref:Uncharacterized protein n=1 Tax=Prorocentrum cordatum TaxID=2364126 RepID=A0ABN9WLT2_9DINO|nr:unnamed protein product [Polarella glacialis]
MLIRPTAFPPSLGQPECVSRAVVFGIAAKQHGEEQEHFASAVEACVLNSSSRRMHSGEDFAAVFSCHQHYRDTQQDLIFKIQCVCERCITISFPHRICASRASAARPAAVELSLHFLLM